MKGRPNTLAAWLKSQRVKIQKLELYAWKEANRCAKSGEDTTPWDGEGNYYAGCIAALKAVEAKIREDDKATKGKAR